MEFEEQMREEIGYIVKAVDKIYAEAKEDGGRLLSEAESKEVEQLNSRTKELKRQLELLKQSESNKEWAEGGQEGQEEQRPEHLAGAGRITVSETSKFRTFGQFLRAVVDAERPGSTIDKRLALRATGMSEGVPADGGFLVQTDFASELLKKTFDTGSAFSRTRQIPVGANSNGLKIAAINETSRADSSRWGGILAYWKDEGAAKTASQPALSMIELKLNKLIGMCYSTDELLEDTTALEAVISQGFAAEFGFQLDEAVINGDGVGKPLGIMNAAALVSQAAEAGQAATTIIYENIVNMWSRLFAPCRANAVWFVNQDIEPQLHTMSLAVGTGGIPVYMPPGGASGSPYSTLYGRPVVPIEQCATLGTTGDIILADMSQYIAITKGGMQSDSSIHLKFNYDETVFRFVYRVDGQPWWNSSLTPFSGSGNTLSPFVALASRT